LTFATQSVQRGAGCLGASLAELICLRSTTACDRVFIEPVAEGRTVTYGELQQVAARWTGLLSDLEIRTGETVGICLSDPVELAAVLLAIIAAGRTAAPFDPLSTDAELAAACIRTSPRLVVSDRAAPSDACVDWLPMPAGAFSLSGSRGARFAWQESGAGGVVLSTSGTTGMPKVIRLDEARLLHTAGCVAAHFELSPADRGFNALPLFHVNAQVVGLLATLVAGATVVLDRGFRRRGLWTRITDRGVTWINAVPAILARLTVLEEGEIVPDGIRFARSAAAPLPVPVLERFEAVTRIPVVETYGMTEAASQITANPLHGPRRPGSAGRPVGTELRVVSGANAEAGSGEIGRVVVRGPGVIRAYSSPGYEWRVDSEGWLETGDLGYLDDSGYLFLVGRGDDVINRGGEKIYPKEVEDAILTEPSVVSVAVVGQDHDVLGRVPVAYLVAGSVQGGVDKPLLAEVVTRVHGRCTELLSHPKRPVAYHVVERLPQGPTGKVRRTDLTGMPVVYSMLVP
jgi:acyl-CoA synthetase (AMP-forming)/AMP-acid ligase II